MPSDCSFRRVSSPLSELLGPALLLLTLFVIGRYFVPPFTLAYALRDTNPYERAEIIKELNVFYRRKRGRIDRAKPDEDPPKEISGGS